MVVRQAGRVRRTLRPIRVCQHPEGAQRRECRGCPALALRTSPIPSVEGAVYAAAFFESQLPYTVACGLYRFGTFSLSLVIARFSWVFAR